MAININKRVFGADIDPLVKRKLAARQRLSLKAPLKEDEKFGNSDPYYLEGSGLSATDKAMTDYSPSNFKGVAELSSRKPFARMWVAMDIVRWQGGTDTFGDNQTFTKAEVNKFKPKPNQKYLPDKRNAEVYRRYEAQQTAKRIYIIGNNQFSRTNETDVMSGQFFSMGIAERGESILPSEVATVDEAARMGLGVDDILPPELHKNQFMADLANIKNISVSTEGSLGLIKTTKIDFSVHNWNDFDKIIFPYFMQPGAKVHVDYGWDSADLYQPECLIGFTADDSSMNIEGASCPEEWIGKTLEQKLYGDDGVIPKSEGDMDVIFGTVVGWDATYTTSGTINCSLELTSQNSALMGSDFDDTHSKFRDMIIQDLDEMFISKAISMFLPDFSKMSNYDDLKKDSAMRKWFGEIQKGKSNPLKIISKVSIGTGNNRKSLVGKTAEDISIWNEIGSTLFTLANRFFGKPPAAGFGNIISEKDSKTTLFPLLTGVFYRRGNEKDGFSANNLYVTWGRFEDDILCKHYGFGTDFDEIRGHSKGNLETVWDSSQSYTRWNEDLVERQLATHDASKLPFLIPSAWGTWPDLDQLSVKGPGGKVYNDRSYSSARQKHPGFDAGIFKKHGEDVDAAYNNDAVGSGGTVNISADGGDLSSSDPTDPITLCNEQGFLPGLGAQWYNSDIRLKRIPLREIFIRLDVIKDAMKENNNIRGCVNQILDTINEASAEVFNWRMGTNDASNNIVSIIDQNFVKIDNQAEDPQSKNYKRLFMFSPYSPNTIVKTFDFKLSTPSDEISSMLAIQGQTRVGTVIPMKNIVDSKTMDAIDWNQLAELGSTEEGKYSADEGNFLEVRYNPNPVTEFDSKKHEKLMKKYNKNLDEHRDAMLSSGVGSTDKNYRKQIMISGPLYEDNLHVDWDTDSGGAVEDLTRFLAGDSDRKGGIVIDDQIEENTDNIVNGVYNYYTEKISNNFFSQDYSTILPAKLSMDIYGTSGIYNGDCFRVDALPKKYRNSCYFQITKVKQTITPNTWTTGFDTQFRVRSSIKKEAYPQNSKFYIGKKTFNNYKNFKQLKPYITEIQPKSNYSSESTLFAENVYTFKCKKTFDEIVENHMPNPKQLIGNFDKDKARDIFATMLLKGSEETTYEPGTTWQRTGTFESLVSVWNEDVFEDYQGKMWTYINQMDAKDKTDNAKIQYKTGEKALPIEITKIFNESQKSLVRSMVTGRYTNWRVPGVESQPWGTLPSSKIWSNKWESEKKFFSNIKLTKDKSYYLVVRKPYWYIFEYESQIKHWEEYFLTMYNIILELQSTNLSGIASLTKLPNLTAEAWDGVQGREYVSLEAGGEEYFDRD